MITHLTSDDLLAALRYAATARVTDLMLDGYTVDEAHRLVEAWEAEADRIEPTVVL